MKPYYQDERAGITIYHARCEDVMPTLTAESVTLLCTDPPYGIRKAGWDTNFPTSWLEEATRVTHTAIALMPGINNLLSLPRELGDFEYRWMLSVHLSNGMTRGLMGFGNWIPVVVYARKSISLYQPQQDATTVPVVGDMPNHPSPKPIRAMSWILTRFTDGLILDPFMGSGTTLRAAKDLGRHAIGIEVNESYCEVAARRLSQEVMSLEAIHA